MLRDNRQTTPFTIGLILLPKFSSLTLSSLVEPLRIANYCDGSSLYHWQYLSTDGTDVPGCSGYTVPTQTIDGDNSTWDALIVCGGWNAERYEDARLFRWLRKMSRRGVILGAAEMGAYVLARAGLLGGHSVAIHWHCHNAFAEQFPDIALKKQLFVIDRNRMTCAGGAACLDMMLHDIQNRCGTALATEVADQMIYAPVRDASTVQLDAAGQPAIPPILRQAVAYMEANVERTIRIPALAKMLGLSQRKLERLFRKHHNCSAVTFYRVVRLQHARVLLTQSDMSVMDICIACGFASSSYFSKSYAEQFGLRPRDHRTAWPETESTPVWPGLNTSTAKSASLVRQSKESKH